MSRGRVFVHVQHLLGIGHVRRAAAIARAMAARGLAVRLATGGMPVADLDAGAAEVVQLPPMRAADERFSDYLDADDRPIDEAWRERRRAALLAAFEDFGPDALMTEAYPFGRRQLRFELEPLLEAARARGALRLASVRDVVQARRAPERVAESAALVREWYDRVLVHGSPAFIRFDESFARTDEIAAQLAYTGYVADPPPRAARGPRRGVVVSAGGGAVGRALMEAALTARPRTRLADEPWRLLAGGNLPDDAFAALAGAAPPGVTVERARPDFPALLAAARLSISQAGYNTVMDLVAAGVRAVLVPFAGDGETEQPLRAARLAGRGAAQVVAEDALDPAALARAVDAALDGPAADAVRLDLEGAATTARLVAEWIAGRRAA